MSQISSINFKKSFAINTEHNDRTLPPSYLIDNEREVECNHNAEQARKLKEQIINEAKEVYVSRTGQRFQAKTYEWSAVCNIKPDTTMDDLEALTKHLSDEYGFQCYQIAIHRDEGHIDEDGKEQINHHAHLEFITLDKQTGINRQRELTPKKLRELQTEVAEILQMQRGQDKRISGRQRVEPRKYAQMKEAEKKAIAPLKQEVKELETELLLTKKEIKELTEKTRNEAKGQGFTKEFFKELSDKKREILENPITQEQYKEFEAGLIAKHKGLLQTNYKAVSNTQSETIAELIKENEALREIIKEQDRSQEQIKELNKQELKSEYGTKSQELEKTYKAKILALDDEYVNKKQELESDYLSKAIANDKKAKEKEQEAENAKQSWLDKITQLSLNSLVQEWKTKYRELKEKLNKELEAQKANFEAKLKELKSKVLNLENENADLKAENELLKQEKEKNDKLQAQTNQNALNAKETRLNAKKFTHYKKENEKITLLTQEQYKQELGKQKMTDILFDKVILAEISEAPSEDKAIIAIKLKSFEAISNLHKPKEPIKPKRNNGLDRC